jgi:hypothetical protein
MQSRQEGEMVNKSRGKKNQPPTGEGKKQSPYLGKQSELLKRSEVLQAQRNHPEVNIGTTDEEDALRTHTPLDKDNPKRPKSGR